MSPGYVSPGYVSPGYVSPGYVSPGVPISEVLLQTSIDV